MTTKVLVLILYFYSLVRISPLLCLCERILIEANSLSPLEEIRYAMNLLKSKIATLLFSLRFKVKKGDRKLLIAKETKKII